MKKTALITAMAITFVTALHAQQGRPGPGPRQGPGQGPGPGMGQGPREGMPGGQMRPGMGGDPLMANLFPPEMIMQNQQALNLTDEQRNYIMQEMQRTQSESNAIQWRLQAAMERLSETVRQDRIDERQVLTQLDSVLSIEKEMKRLQITLLVRLKTRLTAEQQAFLRGRMSRMD